MFPRKQTIECKICNKSFISNSRLTAHMTVYTGEKPFKCDLCQNGFTKACSLKRHIQTVHLSVKFMQCTKSFATKQQLRNHENVHNGIKPYKCDLCEESLAHSGSISSHKRVIHLGERQLHCKQCRKGLPTKQMLSRHERVHSGEKPFQCSLCSKQFSRQDIMLQHLRSHTGEKTYSCSKCGQQFRTKQGFDGHVFKHDGVSSGTWECLFCQACFISSWSLYTHVRTHIQEKPFNCSICRKEFNQQSYLTEHLKLVHKHNRDIPCDLCEITFKTNYTMKKHLKKHLGEKPIKCKICGKEFITNGELKSHTFKHSSIKLFKCMDCDKSFNQPVGLRRHKLRFHTKNCVNMEALTTQGKLSHHLT